MKVRGFTLIELLAVIVILAIIVVIATPIILNIIGDTRNSASERGAELVISNVELAYSSAYMQNNGNMPDIELLAESFDMKGASMDTDGTITVNDMNVSCTTNTNNDALVVTCEANGKTYTSKTMTLTSIPTIDNCDGCVFRKSTEIKNIGDILENYTKNYKKLNSNFFLGHILDNDKKITRSFACGIHNGEAFCLEGKETSQYGLNVSTLNIAYPGCGASDSSNNSYCTGSDVSAMANPYGIVNVNNNNSQDCRVLTNGQSACY